MNVIQTDQIDIAFITASDMPIPDQETHLIVDAVEGMGLRAGVIPWDSSTDWAQIPLVVIRTPWDYFKRLPEFLAWARRVDEITHLVNPYAVIEWSSHKSYLLELSQRVRDFSRSPLELPLGGNVRGFPDQHVALADLLEPLDRRPVEPEARLERSLINDFGGDGEMLQGAEEVNELQIQEADLLILHALDDIPGADAMLSGHLI